MRFCLNNKFRKVLTFLDSAKLKNFFFFQKTITEIHFLTFYNFYFYLFISSSIRLSNKYNFSLIKIIINFNEYSN